MKNLRRHPWNPRLKVLTVEIYSSSRFAWTGRARNIKMGNDDVERSSKCPNGINRH